MTRVPPPRRSDAPTPVRLSPATPSDRVAPMRRSRGGAFARLRGVLARVAAVALAAGRPAPRPAVGGIDCDTAMRRLWDYVDARLPDATRAEVDAHLTACAECPTHVAFAGATRQGLAATIGARPDARADAVLRARVNATLRAAARGTPDS